MRISLFKGQGFLATTSSWVFGFILGVSGAVLSYLFYGAVVIIIAAPVRSAVAAKESWMALIETGLIAQLRADCLDIFERDKYVEAWG